MQHFIIQSAVILFNKSKIVLCHGCSILPKSMNIDYKLCGTWEFFSHIQRVHFRTIQPTTKDIKAVVRIILRQRRDIMDEAVIATD